MAEKRHNRQELISRDRLIEMTLPEDAPPDDPMEDDSFYDEWWRLRKNIGPRHDELVRRIDDSPLKAEFMDSLSTCNIIEEDEGSTVSDLYSFRFDAGDGLVLDFSLDLSSRMELPEDSPFIDKIGRILDIIRRIGPELGDGMRIFYDNIIRWGSFAVDLFQFTVTNPRSLSDFFDRGPCVSMTDEFYILQSPTPYMTGMYMVACRDDADYSGFPYDAICIVFPHMPTPEELALTSRIKQDLYDIGEEVSRHDGSNTGRIWNSAYHIEVFRDGDD